MTNNHMTKNNFLGLDSYSAADGVLGTAEDFNAVMSALDAEKNCALNIDEDKSQSAHKTCSTALDRKCVILIMERVTSFKFCGHAGSIGRKKRC